MLDTILTAIFGNLGREQKMFIVRAGWITLVSVHMLWVCGWVSVLGMAPPFAFATDVSGIQKGLKDLETDLKQDRLERIETNILSVRTAQCRTATDSPARAQYTERLEDLKRQYYRLSGGLPATVPNCDET